MAILEAVAAKLHLPQSRDVLDWEAVYRSELPKVLNFFRYRVGDAALAEDLTASTFEKAWAGRERYRDEGKFSAWLMTIARNVATDHFRTSRSHLPLEAAAGREAGPTPLSVLENKEDVFRLRYLLGRLPDHHRELIALKYGAEFNNREIARLVGMTESNVGTTLHRIVQQLRLAWETRQ